MQILYASRNLGESSAWRDPDSCYRHLAVAAVLQALKESIRGDDQAQSWLLSTGLNWIELAGLNISSDQVVNFIREKKIQRESAAGSRKYSRLL